MRVDAENGVNAEGAFTKEQKYFIVVFVAMSFTDHISIK